MAKQQEQTYEQILAGLKAGQYAPVYYLMGEEGYYIDRLCDYVTTHVLTDEEKEFNQTVVYGRDTTMGSVINMARRYPMMAERQVVVVKEAQNLKDIDDLTYYLQKPMPTTLLVLCHKNGALDRRKKVAAEVKKVGVLFESKKLKEAQLPAFIKNYVAGKGLDIDPKAVVMMADSVGADLCRLTGELDKLAITQPQGQRNITPEQVERNIGISKDYNNFELRAALLAKDVLKANRIIKYFAENPKANPIQATLPMLFSFFSNLMLAYYAPQKDENGLAAFLGLSSPWAAREYQTAMHRFNALRTLEIIHEIRLADARSKGVGNNTVSNADLMRELVYKILH